MARYIPSAMRFIPEAAAYSAIDVLGAAAAWWEADAASNVKADSETTFSQLTDLTGNGNHLTQGTTANRPTIGTGGGLTWAEFDGADDIMSTSSATDAVMNNFNSGGTIFFVARPDTGGESNLGRVWAKTTSGGVERETQHVEDNTGLQWNFYSAYETTVGRYRTDNLGSLGSRKIVSCRVDKTGGDDDMIVRINGTTYTDGSGLNLITAEAGAVQSLSGGNFHIGNRLDTARTFDGGIYAGAVWNTILSDSDHALVEEYWAAKYGITLA